MGDHSPPEAHQHLTWGTPGPGSSSLGPPILTPPCLPRGCFWNQIDLDFVAHLSSADLLEYLFSHHEYSLSYKGQKTEDKSTLNKIKVYISHVKEVQGDEAAPHSSGTQLPPNFSLHFHYMVLTSWYKMAAWAPAIPSTFHSTTVKKTGTFPPHRTSPRSHTH